MTLGVDHARLAELQSLHPCVVDSDYRMCTDTFEREFHRGYCRTCDVSGPWCFWRSDAFDWRYTHVVDLYTVERNERG